MSSSIWPDIRQPKLNNVYLGEPSEELKTEIRTSRDTGKAISTARYYRDHEPAYHRVESIYWLCQAKEYLGEAKLSGVIDLKRFFHVYETIDSQDIFASDKMREIADAIATSPSVKELFVGTKTECNADTVRRIVRFVKKSASLEKLSFVFGHGRPHTDTFDSESLRLLAEALRTNRSLQKLDLARSQIGDAAVSQLTRAIKANPHSNIRCLNFYQCAINRSWSR